MSNYLMACIVTNTNTAVQWLIQNRFWQAFHLGEVFQIWPQGLEAHILLKVISYLASKVVSKKSPSNSFIDKNLMKILKCLSNINIISVYVVDSPKRQVKECEFYRHSCQVTGQLQASAVIEKKGWVCRGALPRAAILAAAEAAVEEFQHLPFMVF